MFVPRFALICCDLTENFGKFWKINISVFLFCCLMALWCLTDHQNFSYLRIPEGRKPLPRRLMEHLSRCAPWGERAPAHCAGRLAWLRYLATRARAVFIASCCWLLMVGSLHSRPKSFGRWPTTLYVRSKRMRGPAIRPKKHLSNDFYI